MSTPDVINHSTRTEIVLSALRELTQNQSVASNAVLADLLQAAIASLQAVAPQVLILPEKTPVNAVAATGTLTLTGNAQNNNTVTIGDQTYTFQTAIDESGVAATGALTLVGNAVEDEVVVIGNKVYRWRDQIEGVAASALLEFSGVAIGAETVTIGSETYTFVDALTGDYASGTLTATGQPQDGARVKIGAITYTYRETVEEPYDVLISDEDAAGSLDNLIAAIVAGDGEGVAYGTGTIEHPDVTAEAGDGDTVTLTAKAIGTAGNAIATTEFSPGLQFDDAALTNGADTVANEILIGSVEECIDNLVAAANGGEGEGTAYSVGTEQPEGVTVAKESAEEVSATASDVGAAGNEIAIGETLTNASWSGGATTLAGGYDTAAANDVIIGNDAEASIDNLVAAITGDEGEGVAYGTGTAAHTAVTATKSAADTVTVAALEVGESGNAIISTTDMANASWAAETLAGGEGAESAYDVLIGATAEDSIDNLVSAIMAGDGAGVIYGTGTVANTGVTATKEDSDKVIVAAKVAGEDGNAITIAETLDSGACGSGAETLSGGVDGTPGMAGEMCADADFMYRAIEANTTADANWRRVALGSF